MTWTKKQISLELWSLINHYTDAEARIYERNTI